MHLFGGNGKNGKHSASGHGSGGSERREYRDESYDDYSDAAVSERDEYSPYDIDDDMEMTAATGRVSSVMLQDRRRRSAAMRGASPLTI